MRQLAVYPDGREVVREVVRHPGAAAVVALDGEGKVCILRQYRPALGAWLLEIPAGTLDPGDATPLTCAVRELAEEAGLTAAQWMSLGYINPSPGVMDEAIHLFLATGLAAVPTAHEEGELIEAEFIPLAEALELAYTGEINDAKTIAALFRAAGELM